jgi:hypothetical protein
LYPNNFLDMRIRTLPMNQPGRVEASHLQPKQAIGAIVQAAKKEEREGEGEKRGRAILEVSRSNTQIS